MDRSLAMSTGIIVVLGVFAVIAITVYIRKTLTQRIEKLMGIMAELRKGNLQVVANGNSKDELDELEQMMGEIVATIKSLIQQLEHMATMFDKEGDIEVCIDATQFKGSYRVVAEGINNMVGSIVNEILVLLDCIGKISSGDFEADIPRHVGKKVVLNELVESLRGSMKLVNREIILLAEQVKKGNLSESVNTENYTGD